MLRDTLSFTVALAREAGAMLLQEFHRPGGPRAHGAHHAEIDTEVEGYVRTHLLAAFPRDSFRGEETGTRAGTSGRCWVVDPNDGTAEFLRNARGPSVSIALVEGGLPRLGVVFAYAAPDDDGDLFAGAEGLGLFRGPGRVTGAPESLPPACTRVPGDAAARVAVSYAAHRSEHVLAANARVCDPWQPLPLPGIAYRLARAAAGDVRVAVTLTGPSGWDMAGGQALLRAVGADLYQADGVPVRYDDTGNCSRSRFYFGGYPEHVEDIRTRDWGSLG